MYVMLYIAFLKYLKQTVTSIFLWRKNVFWDLGNFSKKTPGKEKRSTMKLKSKILLSQLFRKRLSTSLKPLFIEKYAFCLPCNVMSSQFSRNLKTSVNINLFIFHHANLEEVYDILN